MFLAPGTRYEAQIYADGPNADYRTNPGAPTISKRVVTSADSLDLDMASAAALRSASRCWTRIGDRRPRSIGHAPSVSPNSAWPSRAAPHRRLHPGTWTHELPGFWRL
ncbi:glycoside hydrolase family 97 C-terminal domain-containing protein [Sphingopyxis fribergensis]|uniref:glycoside hydrolase family 97 C-terminal domain-containing protein n=1 Tax=Sphingopyxis fribergensis TaxID=1515612 RepID=UPI0011DD8E5E|nr:glycoside hydrolase family 97 C-terminal domain-containing protein [Sphingopyxis fribergensis]